MISENTIQRMWDDYDSKAFTEEEFEGDLMKVIFIGRLLRKFKKTAATNSRILINHIVILNNMFPSTWAEALLEDIEDETLPLLYSCLIFMGRISNSNPHDTSFLEYLERELSDEL